MESRSSGPRTVVLELTSEDKATKDSPEDVGRIAEDVLEQPKETTVVPTTMPAGTGPLYKCAICGELVYESQLNYHVEVCPDPHDEGGPETIAEEEEESENEGEDEVAPLSSNPPNFEASVEKTMPNNDELSIAAVESSPRKIGTSPSREKENDFAQRHATQTQKAMDRRNQIIEELKKKEGEECTFRPKILPRGSPRTFTRTIEVSEGTKWSQRCEQKARVERRKELEARAYADLTLKPKISRFAQEWSQKQQECLPGGQQPLTVFERLYQAALNSREARSAQQSTDVALSTPGVSQIDQISDVATSGQSASSTNRASLQRREDLLYNDAFARVERLKNLADHVHQNSEEAVRDKRQVLDRSRRLYWQMLERQIKIAFDEVADGQDVLKLENLDDFLIRFGCMKSKNERPQTTKAARFLPAERSAAQAAEEDFVRLKSSLWSHLDPEAKGHADCLTLTVFFHVLMGAVDEAAMNSAQTLRPNACLQFGASEGDTSPERTPPRDMVSVSGSTDVASRPSDSFSTGETSGQPEVEPIPSSTSPTHTPVRSGSGSGNMLAAIFEEDGHAANEVSSRRDANLEDTSGIDSEGQRICELLAQFDSTQIRAEFKQLYLHRLHYQAQTTQVEPRFEEVSAPEILAQSRAIAEKVIERQRTEATEAGINLSQHADILLMRHNQAEARKEERRVQARENEVSGCTFRPKMTARPQDMPMEVPPRGTSRNEHLYSKAKAFKERKELRAKEESKARSESEIRGCTFKPDTGRSERSYTRKNEGSAPVPRGFYETQQRLRAANEVQNQKRQQREDRMSKITQHGRIDLSKTVNAPSVVSSNQSTLRDLSPHGAPLPPVAEDSRLQERPLSSRGGNTIRSPRTEFAGRTSGRVLGERSRIASPGNRVKTTSPRGESSQRASSGSARRRVGNSPLTASQEPTVAPREAWGSVNMNDKIRGTSNDGITSLGSGENNMRSHLAQFGTSEHALQSNDTGGPIDEDDLPPPLLYVDVNISPDKPPERIVLREGQSVKDVAADFAAKHTLNATLAQRLYTLLTEVALQRQEQALP